MRRATLAALVVAVGLLLLADLLVVNDSLGSLAALVVDAAIVIAAGAALAGVASLALRRAGDLVRRRGDPVGAVLVIAGIVAMLAAGLRPGSSGANDPVVLWLVQALLVPIGATLFGVLFVSTLAAARRSLLGRGAEPVILVGAAVIMLVLLLPLDGAVGRSLGEGADWTLDVPVAAAFRGLLIGVALFAAVFAVRTLLSMGSSDD